MHDSLTITCNFILMSLIELMDGVGWTYGWVMGPMIFIVIFLCDFFFLSLASVCSRLLYLENQN